MRGAILIYGGLKVERDRKIEELILMTEEKIANNPDVLFIEPEPDKITIGIEQTRGLVKYLAQKPFSSRYKYVIVPQAHKLTHQAQNSLLKTLEEPPGYATIILSSKTQKDLLSTVISRCQKIEIKAQTRQKEEGRGEEHFISLKELKNKKVGLRLLWAEETAKEEKETVIELYEIFIGTEREQLSAGDKNSKTAAENIELMLNLKKDLEDTNVNLKLNLESFVLKLQK